MCQRSAAFRVIRKKISTESRPTQTCGKFPQNHQNAKSQFFTSFCSTFRALCHFCVNEFEKFIFLAKSEKEKGEKEGVGDKHPWMKWGSRKAFSPLFFQITQIKTSSLDALEKIYTKILKESKVFPPPPSKCFFLFQFFQQMNHFPAIILPVLRLPLQHHCIISPLTSWNKF